MPMDFSDVEIALLRKLYHYGYIGHRHTESSNTLRGIPQGLSINTDLFQYMLELVICFAVFSCKNVSDFNFKDFRVFIFGDDIF